MQLPYPGSELCKKCPQVRPAPSRQNEVPSTRSVRAITWLTLYERPAPVALVVIGALLFLSWAAAYYLGGGTSVAPLWFFLPVFLAGLRFGPVGALVASLVATVAAGPLLPADVATATPQPASDWVSRGIFFILIGEFVTCLFTAVRLTSARAARAESQSESESEQRFAALVQRATDMITVIDSEGRLKYESPAVERILGWPAGHRIGLRGEDFVHPHHRTAADAAGQAVLADPTRSQTLEVRLLDSQGSWRWVESTITNMLDEPTVGGVVVNHRVVDERKALEDELIHRAFHDSLTGLANRGQLRGRVKGAIAPGTPGRCHRSVLFIDLDDFKTVNDGFGHDAGDRLLVEVSERLQRCVGKQDLVARLGGDEFAILIEDRSDGGDVASKVAQRVIDALQEPFDVSGHRTRVSASIGIAQYGLSAADDDSVLMRADIAMYHAKANGKDQFVFFTDEMQQGVLHRIDIESWMREALTGDQFRVYYQPIVTLSDGKIEAVEALVRWEHPTLGMLLPDDFLDVAEETGLIVPLGKLVLREACRQIRLWREHNQENLMVSVNLSAAQLRDESIVDAVRLALADAAVGPESLMVEVTEGALIGDVTMATGVLESLAEVGVTIAVDDFGTGYSSLSHLQLFPVDVIKVDKTFIEDLCGGTDHSTLVRSVLAIAREFGLQVVAEGIESEAQEAQLRRLGCDYGQGFLYGHPVPAELVDGLLGMRSAAGVG